MENVQLQLNDKNRGAFVYMLDEKDIGKMEVGIIRTDIAVYHTEVNSEAEGRGIAKKLLETMVNYAREHNLKVIPLCPYVHAQFQRHPDQYGDVWKK